jgi:hypothetical protein
MAAQIWWLVLGDFIYTHTRYIRSVHEETSPAFNHDFLNCRVISFLLTSHAKKPPRFKSNSTQPPIRFRGEPQADTTARNPPHHLHAKLDLSAGAPAGLCGTREGGLRLPAGARMRVTSSSIWTEAAAAIRTSTAGSLESRVQLVRQWWAVALALRSRVGPRAVGAHLTSPTLSFHCR